MPVRVYDEKECVRNHGKEIGAFGKRALIVTGKSSSFSNGSFEDIEAVLKRENIEYLVFSEVEENPSTDTVFSAKEKFADEDIDFVIGIGGGSPMDAAKAIALVLKHPEADLDYLYDASRASDALPVICIPTTCGTGSEVTGVSVLTRHDKKTKISILHKIFPKIALIDGKYISSAPHSLIVNSSVDALSHLYESVLNSKADDYVRMTARAGLKTWAEIKDVLTLKKEADEKAFSELMRSSAFAGMSIAQSGTSLPHALSYFLTYEAGIPHGKAVGYFLSGFMTFAPAHERDELLNLSGFSSLSEFSSFITSVLGKTEIKEGLLDRAYETVKDNPAKMKSPSFEVNDEILKKIVFFNDTL